MHYCYCLLCSPPDSYQPMSLLAIRSRPLLMQIICLTNRYYCLLYQRPPFYNASHLSHPQSNPHVFFSLSILCPRLSFLSSPLK